MDGESVITFASGTTIEKRRTWHQYDTVNNKYENTQTDKESIITTVSTKRPKTVTLKLKSKLEYQQEIYNILETTRIQLPSSTHININPIIQNKDIRNKKIITNFNTTNVPKYTEQLSNEKNNRKILQWFFTWKKYIDTTTTTSTARKTESTPTSIPTPALTPKTNNIDKKIQMVCGPIGCGKTTAVHCIAKHCGFRTVEIHDSDEKSINEIIKQIETMINVKSLQGPPCCIILDDLDNWLDINTIVQKLLQLIKSTKNYHRILRPIICICIDPYSSKFINLLPYVELIQLGPVDDIQIENKQKNICISSPLPNKILHKIIQSSNGDIRSAIIGLNCISYGNDIITWLPDRLFDKPIKIIQSMYYGIGIGDNEQYTITDINTTNDNNNTNFINNSIEENFDTQQLYNTNINDELEFVNISSSKNFCDIDSTISKTFINNLNNKYDTNYKKKYYHEWYTIPNILIQYIDKNKIYDILFSNYIKFIIDNMSSTELYNDKTNILERLCYTSDIISLQDININDEYNNILLEEMLVYYIMCATIFNDTIKKKVLPTAMPITTTITLKNIRSDLEWNTNHWDKIINTRKYQINDILNKIIYNIPLKISFHRITKKFLIQYIFYYIYILIVRLQNNTTINELNDDKINMISKILHFYQLEWIQLPILSNISENDKLPNHLNNIIQNPTFSYILNPDIESFQMFFYKQPYPGINTIRSNLNYSILLRLEYYNECLNIKKNKRYTFFDISVKNKVSTTMRANLLNINDNELNNSITINTIKDVDESSSTNTQEDNSIKGFLHYDMIKTKNETDIIKKDISNSHLIYYSYIEGFSNAVRRPAPMSHFTKICENSSFGTR